MCSKNSFCCYWCLGAFVTTVQVYFGREFMSWVRCGDQKTTCISCVGPGTRTGVNGLVSKSLSLLRHPTSPCCYFPDNGSYT